MTELLFSYGTLRLPTVQRANFGRLLDGTNDTLPGFRLGTVRITDPAVVAQSGSDEHPVLVRTDDPRDQVAGTALEVTPDDLTAADAYEVDDYVRTRTTLASGREAWVYVAADDA
ncbi:hypothetical protein GCM10025864_16230 [Luteimicrobium album]|uniref:Gamma-glutamylcyclotransferase AIG2-like domain-containing protein n=1 Tax=Luteimicrobium album TaxID=1054550 RepID=A0ABQ6I1P1_9MICO|nr:gamma-glutamylcyclotransferase family protein [Luteimicrobium album]GMA23864.1 hypothetical protein GCM10025864_16230 [Luteimicrobium album]